jgi:hypothetical protein
VRFWPLLLCLFACDPYPQPCEVDGTFNGNIGINRLDSTIAPPQLGAADDNRSWSFDLAQATNVFRNCKEISGVIELSNTRHFDDTLFPNLKHVGGIGTFDTYIEEVSGFDGLESIDAIGPVIHKISGFNNITTTPYFEALEINEGFAKLETVGYLGAGSINVPLKIKKAGGLLLRTSGKPPHPDPLPELREIDVDFAFFQTLFETFPFQRVTRIGGDVWIGENGFLQGFDGFAEEAIINGSFFAVLNNTLTSQNIRETIQDRHTTVVGDSIVCFNFGRIEEDPCPEGFQTQIFRLSGEP